MVGIDTNPGLLALARQLVPGVPFAEAPAEAILCGDRTFDLAFLGHVLHEADDLVQALKEARRIATMRVVVLEWLYLQEEQGPPLHHRLEPTQVVEMGQRAEFGCVEHLRLTHMDLYRMAPASDGR